MTIEELERSTEYVLHHTTSRKGYISKKRKGYIEPYSGLFGKGYIVLTPRYDTTQYIDVSYYIKK